MKAILLAGGKGTRLRPLTIHTPKPIVPIFDRPFLHYQLDLLKQVPGIDEVDPQPQLPASPHRGNLRRRRRESGLGIRYVVEPEPLGTGGAVRYAGESLHESVVVFNGDVLTQVDLAAVIALHRERKAKATIVLTPVDNPTRLRPGRNRRRRATSSGFSKSRKPDEITCNTINAGIYILEPDTFDRIPEGHALVDRAQLLSRRSSSAARRSSPTCTAGTGSTSARPRSTCRCTATSWTAASAPPPFAGSASTTLGRTRGPRRRGRDARRSVLHRRGRRRQGRRPHRRLQRRRPAVPRSRSTRSSSAPSSGRTPASARRPSCAAPSSAATATSGATPSSRTASSWATSPSSPTTAGL